MQPPSLPLVVLLHTCRSFLASTLRSPRCLMGWTLTGESGELSQMSMKPRWRLLKMRRKSWKVEVSKVSVEIRHLVSPPAAHCTFRSSPFSNCHLFLLQMMMARSQRHVLSARSIYECLSGCVFVQCEFVHVRKVCRERFADEGMCKIR